MGLSICVLMVSDLSYIRSLVVNSSLLSKIAVYRRQSFRANILAIIVPSIAAWLQSLKGSYTAKSWKACKRQYQSVMQVTCWVSEDFCDSSWRLLAIPQVYLPAISYARVNLQVDPKGDLVLCRVAEAEEKTTGGILLPSQAQKRPTSGTSWQIPCICDWYRLAYQLAVSEYLIIMQSLHCSNRPWMHYWCMLSTLTAVQHKIKLPFQNVSYSLVEP